MAHSNLFASNTFLEDMRKNPTDANEQLSSSRQTAAALQVQLKQAPLNFKPSGKFLESMTAGKDFIEPSSPLATNLTNGNMMDIKDPISPIKHVQDKSMMYSSSRRDSQPSKEETKVSFTSTSPKNIPQINENSLRIYKNSRRAREDEKIIQEILTLQAKKLIQAEGRESIHLQKIPEVTEESLPTQPYFMSQASPSKPTPASSFSGTPARLSANSSPKNFTISPKNASLHLKDSRTSSMKIIPSHKSTKHFDFESSRANESFKSQQQAPQTSSPDANVSIRLAERILRPGSISNSQESPKHRGTSKLFDSPNSTVSQTTTRSPKKSKLQKTFQSPNEFDLNALAQIITAPPLNASGHTIIEHKKSTSTIEGIQKIKEQLEQKGLTNLSPPVREELKKIASQVKQIYLKVVDHRAETLVDPNASPKSKKKVKDMNARESGDQIASEFLKALIKRAEPYNLSPEEIDKYDEIQRLEVILHNLQQIQKSNLLSLLNVSRSKSRNEDVSKRVDSETASTASASKKKKNTRYADKVNETADDLREERRRREDERQEKLKGPSKPEKMKKVGLSAESLYYSALLRQEMLQSGSFVSGEQQDMLSGFGGEESQEQAQLRSWTDMEVWERNQLWLDAKNEKMGRLNECQKFAEMRECTFKPNFITKQFKDTHVMTNHADGAISRLAESVTERVPDEEEEEYQEETENMTEKEKLKSLYQEKKAAGGYNRIFDLKKTFNLYKGEFFIEKQDHRMHHSTVHEHCV